MRAAITPDAISATRSVSHHNRRLRDRCDLDGRRLDDERDGP